MANFDLRNCDCMDLMSEFPDKHHVSAVNRMRKEGYKPFKTNARYWSEMKKDLEWFYGI